MAFAVREYDVAAVWSHFSIEISTVPRAFAPSFTNVTVPCCFVSLQHDVLQMCWLAQHTSYHTTSKPALKFLALLETFFYVFLPTDFAFPYLHLKALL